jgi:hypothetical protein
MNAGEIPPERKINSDGACGRRLVVIGEALSDFARFHANERVFIGFEVASFSENLTRYIALLYILAVPMDSFQNDVAEKLLTSLAR